MVAALPVLALYGFGIALPPLARAFADNPNAVLLSQLVGGVVGFALALSSPIVGWLIDRFSYRTVLLFSCAAFALAGSVGGILDNLYDPRHALAPRCHGSWCADRGVDGNRHAPAATTGADVRVSVSSGRHARHRLLSAGWGIRCHRLALALRSASGRAVGDSRRADVAAHALVRNQDGAHCSIIAARRPFRGLPARRSLHGHGEHPRLPFRALFPDRYRDQRSQCSGLSVDEIGRAHV